MSWQKSASVSSGTTSPASRSPGIDLEGPLRVGEAIHIKGHTTDLEQTVESMQIEHEQVEEAQAGAAIGIKVQERCHGAG